MVKPLLNASEMQKVEHELREFLQDDAKGLRCRDFTGV